MNRIVLLAVGLLLACTVSAEVFWSFGRSRPAWQQRLDWQIVWEEPIVVNGVTMQFQGGISKLSLPELGVFLEQLPADASVAWSDDTVLIQWTPTPGRRQSLLISRIADGLPLVIYGLERPDAPLPPPVWPASLPDLPGIRPQRTIEYPERNTVYGEFTVPGAAQKQLGDWGTVLGSAGWQPLALEAGTPTGTGEIYYQPGSRRILLLGTSSEHTAFVYCRNR